MVMLADAEFIEDDAIESPEHSPVIGVELDGGEEFDPYSDDTVAITGSYLDPDQSEPDLGSTVELGGIYSSENTLTVARSNVRGTIIQNLSGQSTSPPALRGTSSTGSLSGSGPAAGTVDTGPHTGDTTILSASQTLGPSLAEGTLTTSPQRTVGTNSTTAATTTLVQSKNSGLSLGASMVLFAVVAIVGVCLIDGLINA